MTGARGRGEQAGASGRKCPGEEGGRSAGEGGRNRDKTGWLRREAKRGGGGDDHKEEEDGGERARKTDPRTDEQQRQ